MISVLPTKRKQPTRERSSVEPWTEAERKEIEEKDLQSWLDRTLTQLIYYAISHEEFARKLLSETSKLARGNPELREIIIKNSYGKQGRYPATNPAWPELLLHHYAHFMLETKIEDYREREDSVIDQLIQKHKWFHNRDDSISYDSMQNQISAAIKSVDTDTLPDWELEVINERVERGKKRNKK
jgi:hypothetical protein